MAEVTLEEMEAQLATPPVAPKAADIKLEASDLPDFAKGKSAGELADLVARSQQALKISEDARLALSETIRTRESIPSAPPTPLPSGPPALSREQLAELMKDDPMAVMDYMATHLSHQLGSHVENRFRPLVDANINSAEESARQKYKEEFDLFGSQITDLKKQLNPQILSTSKGWDDMMAYIRGQPENFNKLVEKRTAAPKNQAREQQISDIGFTPREVVKTPTPESTGTTDGELDSTQMEICKVMGLSPEEYKKWR